MKNIWIAVVSRKNSWMQPAQNNSTWLYPAKIDVGKYRLISHHTHAQKIYVFMTELETSKPKSPSGFSLALSEH